jgi:hypothetical protein
VIHWAKAAVSWDHEMWILFLVFRGFPSSYPMLLLH